MYDPMSLGMNEREILFPRSFEEIVGITWILAAPFSEILVEPIGIAARFVVQHQGELKSAALVRALDPPVGNPVAVYEYPAAL